MTTDAVARFAVGWAALVAWSIAVFGALERLRPRHREHPRARQIALAASLLAINAALAQIVVRVADVHGGRVALAWLAAELFHYALHRAMHGVPLLWRLHRVHHEAGPLCWTTAWVLHPLDAILNASASVVGAALLGAGLPAAAWFVVGRRIWTIVLHANIRWPASALDGFFATPAFHARHHREDLAAANFAPTLPVIDRIFGTYRSLR